MSHLGVEKARSLMVALKRDKRFRRVLTQKHKHSSAYPADSRGAARRGRGQQRISCKLLSYSRRVCFGIAGRKLWWGTLTPLGLCLNGEHHPAGN